jgi:hypothetical protein
MHICPVRSSNWTYSYCDGRIFLTPVFGLMQTIEVCIVFSAASLCVIQVHIDNAPVFINDEIWVYNKLLCTTSYTVAAHVCR